MGLQRGYCFILFFLFSAWLDHSYAVNNTPEYWNCQNRVGGEWNFGRAPYACDVSSFGDPKVVSNLYNVVNFKDSEDKTQERYRYMNLMNAFIKSAATHYIMNRQPKADLEEVSWWVLGILATANQESFWSHYRLASDNRIKMMRGDFGHGHGMMQIDDRHHFNPIKNGIAWNLLTNMFYALDIYYAAWKKSKTASCISNERNFKSRIRAAYSAYNGGPARICRWTDPNDRWARNDINFLDKLNKRHWQKYIKNDYLVSKLDVSCLAQKNENCPEDGGTNNVVLQTSTLYKTPTAQACIYSNNQLHCLDNLKDYQCLNAISLFDDTTSYSLSIKQLTEYPPQNYDRHELCPSATNGLFKVGQEIELLKDINLRASPGGQLIMTTLANSILKVLDFELHKEHKRYYKVNYNGSIGYVYAGNLQNWADWITPITNELKLTWIEIINSPGINLRVEPDGTLIGLIPQSTQLKVLSSVTLGENNKRFLKVNYANNTGYIYIGRLLPSDTSSDWVKWLEVSQ